MPVVKHELSVDNHSSLLEIRHSDKTKQAVIQHVGLPISDVNVMFLSL